MRNREPEPVGRRSFVGAALAGLGIAGLSARPPKPKVGVTPTLEFGKTGVKLTIVGQGGSRLALLRTREAARAHVRYAYDLGLNYFDCAHSYWDGHSEEIYGDVLFGVRRQVFITTKSGKRTRVEAENDLDASAQEAEDRLRGSLADARHPGAGGHRGRAEARYHEMAKSNSIFLKTHLTDVEVVSFDDGIHDLQLRNQKRWQTSF